ncbi:MAG: polyprenyl synthetase family protein [Candidatus Micrarchaeota archaeon]
MDIKLEIKKYVPEIEQAMLKVLPKKYDKDAIARTVGQINYKVDLQAVNGGVNEPVWELLDRGGKRWRPALMLMVYEALGKNYKEILDFTAIVELVHNGTLLVDDIEDDSLERRGKKCIHLLYGLDIAVNAGNAIYFIPLNTIMKSDLPSNLKSRLYEVYLTEMINVSIGQATDIYWHKGLKEEVSEEEYLQMVSFKTGCLSRMACKLSAVLAGAGEETIKVLGEYGESLGIAFQIQDDILNLIADVEYGKEIGGDISEGKRTLMTIHALKHSAKAKRLREILDLHTKDQVLIEEAIKIISDAGSIEYAKKKAIELATKTWEKVEKTLSEGSGTQKLKALTDYLITRTY